MKHIVTVSGPIGSRRDGLEVPLTINSGVSIRFATVRIPWAALVDPSIVEGINAEVSVHLQEVWRRVEPGSQLPLELWE